MSDQFVGEIRCFGFNFPPTGWAYCAGQLLPISQNTALFSLLGTQYGGDGKSTFALPNLQGNMPIGQGQCSGGSQYYVGEQSGVPSVTLLLTEIPLHNHTLYGDASDAINAQSPNNALVGTSTNTKLYNNTVTNAVAMSPLSLPAAGGGGPHNNMMPYLVMNFCIALQGIFPARQ